jgi:hypothetical protein
MGQIILELGTLGHILVTATPSFLFFCVSGEGVAVEKEGFQGGERWCLGS